MKTTLMITTAAALVAASFTVGHADNSRGERELKKLLSKHDFTGARVSPRAREAAGDRSMAVFDNRVGIWEPAQCSFITHRGKRAMVCDSI